MASSGDLLADRRYAYAEAALAEGDWGAATDLARQALEIAPGFAPAWFLLGTALQRECSGPVLSAVARAEAATAYRRALELDPADALGASLRLALLGEGQPEAAMPAAYVRQLFDEYAGKFDRHLRRSLAYRGPEIVADALRRACSRTLRPFRFRRALDLGCGTGLAGEELREVCGRLVGIDLSPAMIRRAERKRVYDELETGDLLSFLEHQAEASADLVLAVDVFVYVADLAPVLAAAARVLTSQGLIAYTVQSHQGDGAVLGDDHRFAHSEALIRNLARDTGLAPVLVEPVSTRQDRGRDVPGLVFVLGR